jgi:hypothetical protein
MRGFLGAPLLHGVSGSGGAWDEIMLLGMIGGLLVVLLAMSVFSARRRKGRTGRKGNGRSR